MFFALSERSESKGEKRARRREKKKSGQNLVGSGASYFP